MKNTQDEKRKPKEREAITKDEKQKTRKGINKKRCHVTRQTLIAHFAANKHTMQPNDMTSAAVPRASNNRFNARIFFTLI